MKTIRERPIKTSELLNECRGHFRVWSLYSVNELDKDFPIPEQTIRSFKDTVEADEEHKNKSANDLGKEGVNGITLRERLIWELEYFKETGKHLDIENVTLCSGSRYSDGSVPGVRWRSINHGLGIGRYGADYRGDDLRAREAVSNPSDLTLDPLDLESRVKKIEEWIDQWETYDSGWTEYRKKK